MRLRSTQACDVVVAPAVKLGGIRRLARNEDNEVTVNAIRPLI